MTYGGDAGAVMWTGAVGSVDDCRFIGNNATQRGGAVFLQAGLTQAGTVENCENTTFANSLFANNTAGLNGGAIEWLKGARNGVVDNVTFINNTARRSGGAIFWNGINGTVKNSKFENNRATGETLQYNMELAMDDVIIINSNKLPDELETGKLYVLNYTKDGVRVFESYVLSDSDEIIKLDETTTISQTISPQDWAIDQFFGGDGGTILWSGDVGLIDNCSFVDSNSARRGGGAYMTGSGNVTFSNCNFTNSTSGTNGGGVDWLAGARYGKIINCTFNNTRGARSAGAIYYDGWYGQMINITIINAKAWGGSLKESDDKLVKYAGWDSSHWDTNTTGGDAGALMITGSHEYLYNITFINCTATGRGGAVFLQDNTNVTFELCRFENNRALGIANNTWNDDKNLSSGRNILHSGHGGAIGFDLGASNGVIKHSKFINNTAFRDGGAISFAVGSINGTIYNSTFTNNTAKRSGGAFAWNGRGGNISYCNFTNNSALGIALDTDYVNMTSLSQVIDLDRLPKATISTTNKLYVLVTFDDEGNRALYGLYVTVPNGHNGYEWLKLTESNETDPSPTDWGIDQFFGGDGGSIVWGGDNGLIDNCRFIDSNSARRGGGAYMLGSDNVSVTNTYFENSTSGTNGGGLDWLAGANYGKVINCTFNNTRAARSAGAIYYDGDYGEMTNITIINATAFGGALDESKDGKVKYAGWDSSHWDTNTTGGDAGAIMFTGDNVYVYNATFINCTAAGRGGAVFLQDNNNVTFEYCTFDNNSALGIANNTWVNYKEDQGDSEIDYTLTGHGGAIAFDVGASDGTILNSTFNSNHAARDGGAVYYAAGATRGYVINSTFTNHTINYDGGAIYLNGTYCEVHNSTFINNSAKDDGGAIFWQGDHGIIYNITCDYNRGTGTGVPEGSSSTKGGVICLTGSEIALSQSTFTNSYGGLLGGTIFVTGNNVNITDSVFKNSTIGMEDGGALYILGNGTLIKNCTFDNCTAPNNGGTIYVLGENVVIDNSTITNSTAINGGAIYISGHNATVNDTSFSKINATKDGGVLYVSGDDGKLYNSKFINNTAGDDGGAIYWEGNWGIINNITCVNNNGTGTGIPEGSSSTKGGTIIITGNHTVLSESSFANSYAGVLGGTIFITGNDVNVTDSSFKNTTVGYEDGGAIYVTGNDTNILNCTIEDSSSPRNGGAIYVEGDNATISAKFKNTNATLSGGSIYVEGINATITNSEFDNTRAFGSVDNGGGAIYVNGDYASIEESNFTYNYANNNHEARGGAIYITGLNTTVSNSNFEHSRSNLYGGSIYINGANTTVEGSNFTDCTVNSAGSQGGAIYVNGDNAYISESNFEDCKSDLYGGSIYINGINTTVSKSNFTKSAVNNVSSQGGAIYIKGHYATIEDSGFESNTAKSSGGAIFVEGNDANITGSTFEKSIVTNGNGGAMYVYGNRALISYSNFSSNKASNAGAVYLKGSNATIDHTLFTKNTVSNGRAGALYNNGKGSQILYSNFTENSAGSRKANSQAYSGGQGGAILWEGGSITDLIECCVFESNSAQYGGAIRWLATGSSGLIKDCNFTKNNGEKGGTISWNSNQVGHIEDCTFENNLGTKNGGAIYLQNAGNTFYVRNTDFINNTAEFCGADIANNFKSAIIEDCNFINSTAGYGGSIVMKEANPSGSQVINCNFTNTRSLGIEAAKHDSDGDGYANGGGAIYATYSDIKVINSTFVNCSSNTDGGVFKWTGSSGVLINVTITNAKATGESKIAQSTYATGSGGAIYWTGEKASFNNVTISNASAKLGGGIYMSGANANLNVVTVANSTAINGGGIYWANSGGTIKNITVINNTAKLGGGFYSETFNGTLDNINFTLNKADYGSAIYSTQSLTLKDTSLLRNRANNATFTAIIDLQNKKIDIDFEGWDNYLNAIYMTDASKTLTCNNVTYLNESGVVNTGSRSYTGHPATSTLESGQNFTVIVGDAMGKQLNIKDIFSTDANGHITIDLNNESILPAGSNVRFADVYLTNEDYYTYVDESTRVYPGISASTTNATFHLNGTVTVYLSPNDAIGNVSVYINDEFKGNITLSEGQGTIDISTLVNGEYLEVGNHTVVLQYHGDGTYRPINTTAILNVTKAGSRILFNVTPSYYDFIINVTVVHNETGIVTDPNDVTGNVTLNVRGQIIQIELVNGTGIGIAYNMPTGAVKIDATYSGDDNYLETSNSTYANITERIRTLVVIEVSAEDIMVDDTIYVNVTVVCNATVNGNITVILDNVEYNLTLKDSKVSFNRTGLSAGHKVITAIFAGNETLAPSSGYAHFNVHKYDPFVLINTTNITHGSDENIIIKVPADAVGVVNVTITGTVFEYKHILEIENGTVKIPLHNLDVDDYNITVTFEDARYNFASNSSLFKVSKLKPPIVIHVDNVTYGNETNILVEVVGVTGGNVTLRINDTLVEFVNESLDHGNASFTVKLPVGNYTIDVDYSGDESDFANTAKSAFSVYKANPDIRINVYDITFGADESVSVNVNAAGNVTIKVDGITVAENVVLDAKNHTGYKIINPRTGTHSVEVIFSGNGNFKSANNVVEFTVNTMDTRLAIEADNLFVWDEDVINVTVLDKDGYLITRAPGNVTVNINGINYSAKVENGIAVFHINGLSVGHNVIWAFYDGDGDLNPSKSMEEFTVYQRTPDVSVTADNITISQTGKITVNIPENATGYVIVTGNFTTFQIRVDQFSQGVAELPIGYLPKGNYSVYIKYYGEANDNYTIAEDNTTFEVSGAAVTGVTVNVENIIYGQKANITVTVPDGVTGNITLKLNDTANSQITLPIFNNKVNWIVENLPAGNYSVNVTYNGDAKYASYNTNKSFNVTKVNSVITIDVPKVVDAATNATIIVRINDTAAGNITITVNGTKYNATIENGVATFTINKLLAGSYNITAEYIGDGNNTPAAPVTVENALTVTKVDCYQINVTANDTKVDLNTTIVVKVPSDATGNVSVYVDGVGVGNATISHGVAELNVTKPYGNHTVNVTFTDGKYGLRYATTDYWVFKQDSPVVIDVDSILVGETAYINVTAPSDNVTIEINGQSYNSVRYENGIAYFEVSGLAYGNKTVTAIYGGSDKYVANSTTENFTVSKRSSQLNVTATGNSVGSNATISVNVTSGATGYVVVNVNGTKYTINLTASRGSINITGLGNGTYYVHATYIGDDKYLTSRNVTETFEMVKSDVVMNITVESIDYGAKANITVNITSDATGFITIRINETRNITLPIGNGKVNWIVDGLAADNYTVYANYSGDGKYNINNTNKVNESFEVRQISPDIRIVYVGSVAGENATIVVEIDSRATETLNITVDKYYEKAIGTGVIILTTDKLENGTYTIIANYTGDKNFTKQVVTQEFTTNKTSDYVLNITTADINVGELTNITVKVPGDAKGIVIVNINGTNYTATIKDGEAVFNNQTNLGAGRYNITAYFGNNKYANKTATGVFTINKLETPIEVSVNPIKVGDEAVITVTVPAGLTENMTIEIDGVKYNKSVTGTTVVFNVPINSNGTRTVVVSYGGDDRYVVNSTTAQFDVTKRNSQVNVTATGANVDGNALIEVQVQENATGYVTVDVNGTNYTIKLNNVGYGSVQIKGLGNGTYYVHATYLGDDQYEPGNNDTETFVMAKLNTTMGIAVESIDYGQAANITVTITPDATGFITIRINETRNITLPIGNGKVNWIVDGLAADNYTVYANYSGDGKYNINNTDKVNRSFEVRQISPNINIVYVESVAGENATVIVTIDARTTETITINVDEDYVKEIGNGLIIVTTNKLENGTYIVTANYTGDKNFTKQVVTRTFTTNKTSDYNFNITAADVEVDELTDIIVNVPADAKGTVIVNINGTNYTATINDGKAVFNNQTNLGAGRYNITAYFGDDKYANKTATAAYNVLKHDSPLEIKVDSILVGGTAYINVTAPTDNVTIEINGKSYNNVNYENGIAHFEVTGLAYGNKTVTAIYGGSDKYVANTTTKNFTVNKRSSFVNVDVVNTTVGSGAFINVTVPENANGYVIVKVNNINYTINLTDGKGNVTVYNLENETYDVTVTYMGDDQYLSSTNGTKLAINKLTTTFEVNGTNITVGSPEFITIETPDNITGMVKVEIDGVNHTAFIYEGKGNLTVRDLKADVYNVTVYFEGNNKFLPASAKNNFTVNQTTTEITIVPQNITYGESETVVIYINATGKVNVTVGDDYEVKDREIIDGMVTVEVPGYLTAGNYTVEVSYGGNENYTNSSAKINFTVSKADPTMTVDVQNITYGDVEHIIVNVNASGNVTIKVNNTQKTIILKEGEGGKEILRAILNAIEEFKGKATLDVYNLEVGEYPVEVIYNGNENYNKATANAVFFVTKDNVTLSLDVENIRVDGKEIINVTFNNTNVTGKVIINVDGKNYTRDISQGKANLTLDKLTNATHSVVVIYEGDRNFNGNWTSDTFNVSKVKPAISVELTNRTVGQTEKVIVHLPDNATGYVVIDVDGTKYHVDIVEGEEIALEIDSLENRTYDVHVDYSGDGYYENTSASGNFNVSKVKSDITVKVENITLGDVAVVNITVTPGATGNVTITIGDEFNRTVGITDGVISVDVSGLTVGDKIVNVTYNGDEKYLSNHNSTTFSVAKFNSTSNIEIVDNGNGTVTVIVPQNATGNVTIYVDGKNFTANVTGGIAVITLENVTPGKHDLTAVYSGDGNYTNATADGNVTIPKLTSPISVEVSGIKVGDVAYINVTAPSGDVSIEINGKQYDPVSFDNGIARFAVENLAYGNKTVAVTYEGNSNYTRNFTTANFTVDKRRSDVKVDVLDIDVGDVAYINVTVPNNATGHVVVSINGTNYTINLTEGKGILPVKGLGNGTYDIVAIYLGDEQYFSSVNDTQTFTVSKVQSQINITVSHDGIIANGSDVNITIEAPVDATGKVNITVSDGLKNITCTVYVNDGKGVLHIDNPEIGIYNVTAKYLGDDKYLGSDNSTEFEVYLAGKALAVDTEPITVAENEEILVFVSGNHAGDNVTIIVRDSEGNIVAEENATFSNYYDAPFNATSARLKLDALPAGEYSVEAVYIEKDGSKLIEHTGSGSFEVSKLPSALTIKEIRNITVGENVTIELEISPDAASGNISVFVNGVEHKLNTTNLTLTIPNLGADEYIVHAFYYGSDNYTESNASSVFKVSKAVPQITVNATNITVGDKVLVEITAPEDIEGPVLVDIAGVGYYVNITEGKGQLYVPGLASGEYNVTVKYFGDDKYDKVNNTTGFKVSKVASSVNVAVENITVGDKAVINVETPKDLCGNVTVSVDGANYTVFVSGGKGTLVVPDLDVGPHTVDVIFDGCKKYEPSDNSTTFNVNKVKTTESEIKVVNQGNGTVVVVVPNNATGNVTVKVGDKEFNATVVNGTAVVQLENVTPGTHEVEVIYSGDDNYDNITSKANVTAPKYDTPIEVEIGEAKEGEPVNITVRVPENATGNVTVNVGGKNYTVPIDNGEAKFTIDNLTDGDHTFVVSYPGDDNYAGNYSIGNLTVAKAKEVPDMKVIDYGNGTVAVVVGDNATGNVTVKVGDREYNATVVNGTAVVELDGNVTPGTHEVEVIYSGDDTHEASNTEAEITAPKYDSPINITVSEIKSGENGTVVVKLSDGASGNVTVSVDGKKYPAEVINGTAVVKVDNLTAGPKTLIVEYSGDENHTSSYEVANFTVEQSKVVPDIRVVDQGNGTIVIVAPSDATGNVTVKIGDKKFNATIVNGTAVIQLDNVTPGEHDIEVVYGGDSKYSNATSKDKITAPKLDTPIKVEAEEIKVGDKAIIKVTVPEDATGNITIEIDGEKYSSEIKDGVAVFEIENLTSGTKTIAVDYDGDDNYLANHTASKLTVSKRHSFVNATITNIDVGENVTITVTVPDDATGQVLIDIDGVGYYVNVTNGKGTAQIPRMPSGVYDVALTYTGDDKYLPASNTGLFNVSKIPSFVIPHAVNITVGENEVITLTVPSDATGSVTVVIDGKEYDFRLDDGTLSATDGDDVFTVAIDGGNGKLTISNLPKGEYVVSVKYNGDDKYLPSTNSTTFLVSKQTTDIDVEDLGNGTVIVHVPKDATGNVTVKVGNETYVAEVSNGTAVINLNETTPGTRTAEVTYSGDDNYASKSVTTTVNVPKYPTPISVDVDDIKVGDTAVITVTVPEGADGKVTIEIEGISYTQDVVGGRAIFHVDGLKEGDKTVAVTFNDGDSYERNSTTGQFKVSKVESKITASSKDIKVGKDEVITVNVPSDATGRVLVKIDGVGYYGDIVNGKAKIILPELPSGKYKVTVVYEGDDKYLSGSTTTSFTVSKVNAPVKASGDDIKQGEDATVVVNVPSDATGTVTIKVDGKTYTADVKDGKAIFVIPGLTKGDHDVSAYYSGDRKYNANDTVTDIEVHYAESPNHSGDSHEAKAGIDLTVHETGNPIFLLLLIVLAVGSTQIRRFRK